MTVSTSKTPDSARLQSLEKELLTLKVHQVIGDRKFISTKARQDFEELIVRSTK